MATTRRALLASWRRLIRAQGDARAWVRLDDPFDPVAEAVFVAQAAAAIERGRATAANLTGSTLRRMLIEAEVAPPRGIRVAPNPEPRGITLAQEMLRPGATARFQITQGVERPQAMNAGLIRAKTMADTDIAMAGRDAFLAIADAAPRIVGYRRVVHPELSRGGTCGLCIAAATRIYRKSELMPLHDRCQCEPVPVLDIDTDEDLAQTINGIDLEELYIQLGETTREKLKHTRVKVEEHGELGPVLRQEGHAFRDADKAAEDARPGTPIGEAPAA
jgi:hypothetical protein